MLKHTTLYTLYLQDNNGITHEVQAYRIDKISQESVTLDLHGVRAGFPRAPKEVYERPDGPIDLLIGSMYKNLQPCGGENGFTRGRLRLVKSLFGCGYILTGLGVAHWIWGFLLPGPVNDAEVATTARFGM